jgi:putative phosphotransacetylase
MTKKIIVETSARHIHLTKEAVEALFGEGYSLTKKKELSQPGEFACEERVTVVGPKSEIKNVIVLGPTRAATQVELSATDARSIGIANVVRQSGEIAGTPGCKLVGPFGEIEISEGVIVAKRHVHFTPEDAASFGVSDGQIISVKVDTDGRSLTFGDVVCRVRDTFATAMHIDTDESNAAGCARDQEGTIVL